jgi:hypothetical protein
VCIISTNKRFDNIKMHSATVKMNVSEFTLVSILILKADELTESCVPQLVSMFQILLCASVCKNAFLLSVWAKVCAHVRACVYPVQSQSSLRLVDFPSKGS